MLDDRDLLFPPGSCLLHIGPHKTATSAVQSSFHAGRERIAQYGVHYAGRHRHSFYEAVVAAGTAGRPGDPTPSSEIWDQFATEVRALPDKRVVVSSEMFDDADEAHARSIVRDLGGDRVQVVATLRPIARMLPSAWQQYIRNRVRVPYDEWLDAMLNRAPYSAPTPSFWRRNRFDLLLARWAQVVGPDRVTVVMVDDADPFSVLNTFERFTGLPLGTLVPEPGRSNRSLTYGEVELFRRINEEFARNRWPDTMFAKTARDRFLPALQDRPPSPGEAGIPTPMWAVRTAAARGAEMAAAIDELGVRVVGDLAQLASTEVRSTGTDTLLPPVVPIQAAFDLMMAAWNTPAPSTAQVGSVDDSTLEERPAKQLNAAQLARILGERARRRVVDRVRPAERRMRPDGRTEAPAGRPEAHHSDLLRTVLLKEADARSPKERPGA